MRCSGAGLVGILGIVRSLKVPDGTKVLPQVRAASSAGGEFYRRHPGACANASQMLMSVKGNTSGIIPPRCRFESGGFGVFYWF